MSSDNIVPEVPVIADADIMGMKPNTYCMLLHFSQLLSFVIPFGGVIAPIVLWSINKDKSTLVDQHGRIVLNWLISFGVYLIAGIVFPFIFLLSLALARVYFGAMPMPTLAGLPFSILCYAILKLLTVAFSIIGALKANDGTIWKYPLSIPFFR